MSDQEGKLTEVEKPELLDQIATLFHQVRSPLLTIKMEAARAERDPECLQEVVEMIGSRVDVINSMLDEFWSNVAEENCGRNGQELQGHLSRDSKPQGSLKILIVEDDEMHRLVASRILAAIGHTVFQVEDGESALVQLEKEHMDVIFADVRLPGLSGINLARHIRQADCGGKDAYIIGMSNDPRTVMLVRDCLDAGMNDYFEKPLTGEAALRLIGMGINLRVGRDS